MKGEEFEREVRKLVAKAVEEDLRIGDIISVLEGTKFLVMTGWVKISEKHRRRIEEAMAK